VAPDPVTAQVMNTSLLMVNGIVETITHLGIGA